MTESLYSPQDRARTFADPALAARLLGVDADALLEGRAGAPPIPRDGPLLGALFESLVTLSLRTYAQAAEATVGHLRTSGGAHEVDLVVERADGRVLAIQVKLRPRRRRRRRRPPALAHRAHRRGAARRGDRDDRR
jgi:predicted AAA+ superfamily ATPase